MDKDELRKLRITLKRMKNTKPHEGICLMGWQAKIVLDYINYLKVRANRYEQVDDHRKSDP